MTPEIDITRERRQVRETAYGGFCSAAVSNASVAPRNTLFVAPATINVNAAYMPHLGVGAAATLDLPDLEDVLYGSSSYTHAEAETARQTMAHRAPLPGRPLRLV